MVSLSPTPGSSRTPGCCLQYLGHLLTPAAPTRKYHRVSAILFFEPSVFTGCQPLTCVCKVKGPHPATAATRLRRSSWPRSSRAAAKHCPGLARCQVGCPKSVVSSARQFKPTEGDGPPRWAPRSKCELGHTVHPGRRSSSRLGLYCALV